MAINFNSFTEGTTSNIQSNDYVVGFDNTSPGGERKWTVSTIANAVSGVMKTQLNKDISDSTSVTILSATLSGSKMVAKAWAVLNGSNPPNTIINSYNISGITVVGNFYRISFQSPMPNVNYAVLISSMPIGVGWAMPVYHYGGQTVNYFEVAFGDSDNPTTYYASSNFSVAIFGN
jgi:hypothetical protein